MYIIMHRGLSAQRTGAAVSGRRAQRSVRVAWHSRYGGRKCAYDRHDDTMAPEVYEYRIFKKWKVKP